MHFPSEIPPHALCFLPFFCQILAHSLEIGNRSVSSGSRRGLFWNLRAKQSRVGLFEIGPGHELHRMTRMMQEGLWAATQVSRNNPPKVNGPSCPIHLKPSWQSISLIL